MRRMRPRGRSVSASSAAVLAFALLLTACDALDTEPDVGEDDETASTNDGEATASGGSPDGYSEAPMLAELVDAGELPPVEERLPTDPLVVEPSERIGTYGGEWNSALLGVGDWPWLGRTVGYENLTRWTPEWDETIPNLAESWEYNDDATELTYTLRDGLKWSDGEPFTSADIEFALNDVIGNPEVTDAAATNPPQVEVQDELTFTLHFHEPQALFASHDLLAYQIVTKPRHYLEQFHADYNDDVDALAEEEGFDSWVEMLDVKAGVTNSSLYWQNADIPTMYPWMVIEPLSDGGRMVLERNPYYWKVDPEGNQLPYIDRVTFDIVADEEVMLTRAMAGDINMHSRHFNTLANRPILAENRERGGYDFFDIEMSEMNTSTIALNMTHEDERLREIFNTKDFRIALSHAINREEIIDVVYQQQGQPWQAAPREDTPFFNEQLATQYTEYDPDLARSTLEDAGFSYDGDALLAPDGDPITFDLTVASGFRPDVVDSMEMVVGYWNELGVDVRLNSDDRSIFYERKENNDYDATVWVGDSGMLDALWDPRWYLPVHSGESNYAIPWAQWYASDGTDERGEEPPAEIQEHQELYDELLATPEEEDRFAVMERILELSAEHFYAIGISLSPPSYGIVANDFHNVPESLPGSAVYNDPAPTNPETYFIED